MIEIIIGSVMLLLIFAILIGYYRERRAHRKIIDSYVRVSIDNDGLKGHLADLLKDNETLRFSENQDFIKFLSDSRDMAFSYIEDVQSRIRNLQESMKSEDPKLASVAIESLIEMLPKEEIPNN